MSLCWIVKAGAAASMCLLVCPAFAQQSAMQKMLKPLIAHQCTIELKASNLWKASTFLMTAENKKQFEDEVCGCVSDNALNEVSAAELAHAVLNDGAKNQLIRKAAVNSVKGCIVKSKR